MSIRSRFIQLLVIWPDPTHWPTDPPNHPHTHPWVGVCLQIINLQTELNYVDLVKIYSIVSHLTWPHPLTHPTTHTPTHGWVCGWGVSTNYKSLIKIELPRLGQEWLNFKSFDLTPPIDPPIHPHTHTHSWVGVSLQNINLQTELNNLDSVNNF